MCPLWGPRTCRCLCWSWDALAGLNSSHIPCLGSLYLHRARSEKMLCHCILILKKWSKCWLYAGALYSHFEPIWLLLIRIFKLIQLDFDSLLWSDWWWFNYRLLLLSIPTEWRKCLNVWSYLLQLPHGLPPTSLNLETEVEKQFLRDPAWLPIHDTDFVFQKFLKCVWCLEDFLCISE